MPPDGFRPRGFCPSAAESSNHEPENLTLRTTSRINAEQQK